MSQPTLNDDRLQHWQSLTRDANAAFAWGHLYQAHALYRQALVIAEQRLCGPLTPDPSIAAYAVSCLNFAEALDRDGNNDGAAKELVDLHLHLLKMSLEPTLSHDWRDAALRHRQRSRLELQHFLRTHAHPGIARLRQASQPPSVH